MLTRTLSNRVLGDSTESATTDVSGQEPEIPGYL
jgi:hypothetical protein